MRKLVAALVAVVIIAAGWVWYEASDFLHTSPEREGHEVYVDIQSGQSMAQVAENLQKQGVVCDARKFTWLARYKKQDKRLQAGRFRLNTGWLPEHVLEVLVNGQPALYRVTIPEGLTWWQTGQLLEAAGLARYEDFEEVVRDPEFLRHYGIPFATAEGFLMPDTYLLKKPESPMPAPHFLPKNEEEQKLLAEWKAQARSVAGRLVDNFWRKAEAVWPGDGAKPDREKLRKWVVMASIVEKETGVPRERSRVAGVYENRLAKNMLLQADPTVIYGMGPTFQGKLRRVHLQDDTNGYNTYVLPGLPPGPIASFGMAALKAAVRPEKHNYLFFVATGVGDEHTFTRNFEEHSQAVRDYRRVKQGK